jgi:hypothetical protein
MRTYTIFQSPDGRIEAVKHGFSWPGFLFGIVWMLFKRLWMYAAISFGVLFILGLLDSINEGTSASEGMHNILTVAYCLISALIGAFGNLWRQTNLRKRGFESITTVEGHSVEGAISEFHKGQPES